MAKKKSKIAKALAAGLAAYGVAKMMGKKLPVSGKDSDSVGSTYDQAGVSMLRPEDTSARARIRSIGRRKMYQDMPVSGEDEMFGLGAMDGAKYGKMIKAKHGTMVMGRGQGLSRKKPTKIF
jgi:hypothetical protein